MTQRAPTSSPLGADRGADQGEDRDAGGAAVQVPSTAYPTSFVRVGDTSCWLELVDGTWGAFEAGRHASYHVSSSLQDVPDIDALRAPSAAVRPWGRTVSARILPMMGGRGLERTCRRGGP